MAAIRPQGRDELSSTPAREIGVDARRLRRWVSGFGERHGGMQVDVSPETIELVGGDAARAWIDVPFAPLSGDDLDALFVHVETVRSVGVLLVRRGGYAAGVFAGRDLVASKVGSAYVQGTTKAGGWSQQRYARRRANQSAAAFAEAADAAARVLAGVELDAVFVGGDREGVRAVLGDPRLSHLDAKVTGGWLEVKDPKLKVLQAMPEQFLAVRIKLVP